MPNECPDGPEAASRTPRGGFGDPLWDLAVLLSYWTEADDPAGMQALGQMPTAEPGFPGRAAIADAYAAATGRSLSGFAFHRALASFRLAVVFRQLYNRWRDGGTEDPAFARFGDLSDQLLEFAHDVAQGQFA